ncbi:MAG: esterase-like activity of phytase family protein [Pseudomonadota bacterium]
MRASKAFLLASVMIAYPLGASADGANPVDVTARPIANFLIGSDQRQFGRVTFKGGLEMVSRERHFGAISAVEIDDDTAWLIADTGFWVRGRIDRDADGAPTGLSQLVFSEIKGAGGARFDEKWQVDAEGVAVNNDGDLLISFERDHRIAKYRWSGGGLDYLREEVPPVPLPELRQNQGFEGIAIAPDTFSHAQAVVGVTEKSLDEAGNIMGFVNPTGPANAYEFSVKRTDGYDVTDVGFLPDGDMLLLERRFNISQGISMRLRHIEGSTLTKGGTVDGRTLLEADMRYQIDNMEGLAITPIGDKLVRLTIVSDDNKSLLQRSLLLEFELALD